jgi:uncharacterized membrane protein
VVVAAAGYAYSMSRFTLYNHQSFRTYNYDLGQYDNVFWNALHGRPLRCTPLGNFDNWTSISGHADISVFFFLPLYALYPHAETLLVMQSCILALGAIPIYLFAVRRIPASQAATLAVCYLLYPPLHGSNLYDFHMQPVASTFVLLTIYFLDGRKWLWCAASFVVAINCREDISVGLTMLGLYCILSGYRVTAGSIMAAVGTAYFIALRFVIMPHFGPSWFSDIYKDLYPQPNGPHSFGGVIYTLATNPIHVFRTLLTADKLRYFLQIATPVVFMPMRRGYLLPALAPGTLFTLLTTAYPPTVDIAFQYSGHFTPYLFVGTAAALAAYRREPRVGIKLPAAVAAIGVATLLCTIPWGAVPFHGPVRGGFVWHSYAPPSSADIQRAKYLAEVAAMIPEDAKFSVSEEELPHVSGRLNVMTLKYDTGHADYLLYGTSSVGSAVAQKALLAGEYVEVARRGEIVLLKSAVPDGTPRASAP